MSEVVTAHAVVIGGGPGGYVCGIRLGQLGVDTIVVEAGELGGVCLNVGCIPSKALITASKHAAKAGKLAAMGITVGDVQVDVGRMQDWKNGVVTKLTTGVAQLLKGNKVRVMRGRARVVAPGRVEVDGPDGVQTIEAREIVVATGSVPIAVPGFAFDGEHVVDSTGGLAFTEAPRRLVVIGGGYIGLELGSTWARLGTEVTIVEMMDQLLAGFEADLVRPVERALKKQGVRVLTGARAKAWRADGDALVCEVERNGKVEALVCDRILVTVGRRPLSAGLGLEALGVAIDGRGFIQVDAQRRTSVPGIWAIGDVAGNPMLAHKASKEGEVAAEAIAGRRVAYEPRCIPAIVFTDPEIATVGLSAAEAKEAGREVTVGRYPFAALGRALTTGETEGFVRVVMDAGSEELLGVQIVGPGASDLVAEAALAIEMGALAEDVGLTVHAHPSLPEAVMEAAKAARGEAIHALNR